MEIGNNNFIFCSNCGSKSNIEHSFCKECGCRLNKSRSSKLNFKKTYSEFDYTKNEYVNNNYTSEELSSFISKNQGYYLEKFNLINSTGDKKSWNWSSFICGLYWLLYRKMYIQALIYFAGAFVLAAIPVIGWALDIILWIGLGMYGNTLYLDHINRKFEEINLADSSLRQMLINKNGGTNIVLPIILLLLPVVIVSIFLIMAGIAISSYYVYY